MKKLLLLPVLILLILSCKKENPGFNDAYSAIPGIWNLESVAYDSSGVEIIRVIPYNKLVINSNLGYNIFMDQVRPVENGTINIVTQTSNKLVLYFAAVYPAYSSYAGSHIFGMTNVELISLADNKMIFKTIDAAYAEYSDQVITFIK